MAEKVKLSKDGSSIDFVQSESLPTSVKKFRQSPEIEGFYRFIFENDLQKEAYEILDRIIIERKSKKALEKAAAKAAQKAIKAENQAASKIAVNKRSSKLIMQVIKKSPAANHSLPPLLDSKNAEKSPRKSPTKSADKNADKNADKILHRNAEKVAAKATPIKGLQKNPLKGTQKSPTGATLATGAVAGKNTLKHKTKSDLASSFHVKTAGPTKVIKTSPKATKSSPSPKIEKNKASSKTDKIPKSVKAAKPQKPSDQKNKKSSPSSKGKKKA